MSLCTHLGRLRNSASFAVMRHVVWCFNAPTYVVLLGGPGAGKGTLADELGPLLGLLHVSTGNLFRREIASGSPLGKVLQPILESGGLVPDAITIAVLAEELSKWKYRHGAIIDGFPRTAAQAGLLDQLFNGWSQKVNFVFFLDGTKEDLEVRLSGRRICSNKSCAKTYHVLFSPPKVEGKCDKCGSPLEQRKDDAPDVVQDRIETFNKMNAPILAHYDTADNLYRIKTTNRDPKGHVLNQVLAILKKTR